MAGPSRVVLWLFVINLGIAFGAGLYEHRIVVSRWIGSSPGLKRRWDADAARRDDTGRRFWVFVTTVPLTLLTLANVIAAWAAPAAERSWWLAAAFLAVAERILTLLYFIPTMIRLMPAADSPRSQATAIQWSTLNYARHGFVLLAWLTALKTFALIHQHAR